MLVFCTMLSSPWSTVQKSSRGLPAVWYVTIVLCMNGYVGESGEKGNVMIKGKSKNANCEQRTEGQGTK